MLTEFNSRFAEADADHSVEGDLRAATAAIQLTQDADDSAWRREVHFEARLAKLDEIRNHASILREEHQIAAIEATKKARWTQPEPGDHVLKRRFALDNQKGKKMEP